MEDFSPYWPSKALLPSILAIDANGGEVLEVLREFGYLLWVVYLIICLLCFASLCFALLLGYIEETTPSVMVGNICNEIQVHSHMYRLWGSLLYILWFY